MNTKQWFLLDLVFENYNHLHITYSHYDQIYALLWVVFLLNQKKLFNVFFFFCFVTASFSKRAQTQKFVMF